MDEPTATLTPGETDALFRLMDRLRAEGATIIYISHKLDEVAAVCDTISVIRDGKLIGAMLLGDVKKVAFLTQSFDRGLPLPEERVELLFELAGPTASFLVGGVAGVVLAAVLWARRGTLAPEPVLSPS